MKIITLLVCFFAIQANAWELYDVSVLLPLPKTSALKSQLMSTKSSGAKGPLVHAELIAQLPRLVASLEKAAVYDNDLRVVGVRFDPCFDEGTGPVRCRRQIRMSWQPIVKVSGNFTSIDATLHTFYEFDERSWDLVIEKYRSLLKSNPVRVMSSALQINPRVLATGLEGAYYQTFRKFLLENCGRENLVRATVMTRETSVNEWRFLGYEVSGNTFTPIKIANIGTTVQKVTTIAPRGNPEVYELRATVNPNVFTPAETQIYSDSSLALRNLPEAAFKNFAEAQLIFENPGRSNPGTVDCATCHIGSPATQFARLNFSTWDWKSLVVQSGWSTTRNTKNLSLPFLKPRRMRAFGFFNSDPLFSQRTINESAVAADALDQTFPFGP